MQINNGANKIRMNDTPAEITRVTPWPNYARFTLVYLAKRLTRRHFQRRRQQRYIATLCAQHTNALRIPVISSIASIGRSNARRTLERVPPHYSRVCTRLH